MLPFNTSQWHLYLYLAVSYARFRATGECPASPFIVQIQTQSHCNGACTICPYRTVSRRLEQGVMESALFERIAAQLGSGRFFPLLVLELHNEPLLDKRMFDLVKHLKSLRPRRHCLLVTNGELLDRFSTTEIAQSNLDELVISLNAHSKETFERINAGLSYDRVMGNVAAVLSDKRLRGKVSLSFVVTRDNMAEVCEARRYWMKRGVRTRAIRPTNRAGTLDEYGSIMPTSPLEEGHTVSRAWGRLVSRVRNATGCVQPFYHLNVLFNGDCIVCCHDWGRQTVIGNAADTALEDIWNSERMNEIRRAMLRKDYERIDACRDCSLAH